MFWFVGESSGLRVVVVDKTCEAQFKLTSAAGIGVVGAIAMFIENVKVNAGVDCPYGG